MISFLEKFSPGGERSTISTSCSDSFRASDVG